MTDIFWGIMVAFMIVWCGFSGAMLPLSVMLYDFWGIISETNIGNNMNQIFSGNTSKLLDICVSGTGNYSSLIELSSLTQDGAKVRQIINDLEMFFVTSGITYPVLR